LSFLDETREQLRLELVRLGEEQRQIEAAMKALDRAGAAPDAVGTLARPATRSASPEAPKRPRGRPQTVVRGGIRPAPPDGPPRGQAPPPPSTPPQGTAWFPAPKPSQKKRGRPPKAKPPAEPPQPVTADMPGAVVMPSHTVSIPSQVGAVQKKSAARVYRVCPNCHKRTETNPCHVCGDKLVMVANLRAVAPVIVGDAPSREANDLDEEG